MSSWSQERLKALEAANHAFYEAFEAQSLEQMLALWLPGEDVFCVHPGSDLLTGWDAVRRSWEHIIAAPDLRQFILTDVRTRMVGDVGIVTCTENIMRSGERHSLRAVKAVAANTFAWGDDRTWKMLAHHASPAPQRA